METPTETPRSPEPPSPPAVRRLRRRTEEGKVAGVCAGLADYLGVDVTVVRLLAVLLLLVGPGGPAYLVAWLVVPEAGPDDPPQSPASVTAGGPLGERGPQLVGAGLLLLALVVVWDGWDWPGRRFLLPLVLIAAGVALLTRRPPAPPPDVGPPAATEPFRTGDPGTMAPSAVAPTVAVDASLPAGAGDDVVARRLRRRRRTPVTPVTIGLALVWAGLAFLAGVSVVTGLAVALGILGVGLVAGGVIGGGQWLIAPAVVVTLALMGTAAVDVPLTGGVGERRWVVDERSDVGGPFRLAAGEGVLDLRDLDLGAGETVAVVASVAMGELEVRVPDGVDLVGRATVSAGNVRVFGDDVENGLRVDVELDERSPGAAGTVEVDLAVGLGEIVVTR